MIDWKEFIKCNRNLLIAPAGHGKTTAITDCILQCPEGQCQLILTHTHAGIASLRNKFSRKNIPSSKYHIETITGFAQRYVLSYLGESALPPEDDKEYFDIAVNKCKELLQRKVVQMVVVSSYSGVFIDEYQDCTIDQHNMIKSLANNLPLHILGDPLQGIFSFNQTRLVDFKEHLSDFTKFELLTHPWRWAMTNPALGQSILNMRHSLENGNTICFKEQSKDGVSFHLIKDENEKYKCLAKIINKNPQGLLIIYPSYTEYNKYGAIQLRGGLNDRISLKQRVDFANHISIIDAIDSNDYYALAKIIDQYLASCIKSKRTRHIAKFYDILCKMHIKVTELNKWIKRANNCVIKKKGESSCASQKLKEMFDAYDASPSLLMIQNIVSYIASLPNIKFYHKELLKTIKRCFKLAITNSISMFEAMKLLKARARHYGRRIDSNCIGTTLLTKGLEFETVVLWDAHKFSDEKHFYVAISRACKNLVLISETNTFKFSNKK